MHVATPPAPCPPSTAHLALPFFDDAHRALAAGLVPHTGQGGLQVGGQAPRQGNPQVGYMLARDSLLPWKTALGNAMFGMEVRGVPRAQAEERARSMLQEVGLGGFFPQKNKQNAARTKAELKELFGGKIPFSPIYNAAEIFADPHYTVRQMLPQVEQPGSATPVCVPGVPVKLSLTPGEVRHRAPLLGEHSRQILAEVGVDATRIQALIDSRIFSAQ